MDENIKKQSLFNRVVYWFKNYWYYYKFRTIALLFVIGVIVFGIVSCMDNEPVDLVVYYLSKDPLVYSDDKINLANRIKQYASDFDKNGTKRIEIVNYWIGEEYDKEAVEDMLSDFNNTFKSGGIMLILADEAGMDYLTTVAKDTETQILSDLSKLTDKAEYDNTAYKLNSTPFMDCNEMKYWTVDVWMCLRVYNEKSWIKILPNSTEKFEYAKSILVNIIDNTPVN